jgi:hypothetical protein
MSGKRRTIGLMVLLGLSPFIAIFGFFAVRYGREIRAGMEIRQQIASLQTAGHPTNIQSLQQSFYDRSSQEHTIDWGEIAPSMSNVEWARNTARVGLPIIEFGSLLKEPSKYQVRAISTRGDDPVVAKTTKLLSEESQPVLKRIRELLVDDKIVWIPTDIDVSQPHFLPWVSFSISDLLLSEVELAVHDCNIDLALELLFIHNAALRAFDWQTTVGGEFQRARVVTGVHHYLLFTVSKDCSKKNVWNADQLTQLIAMHASDASLSKRWRMVIAAERAIALETVGGSSVGTSAKVLTATQNGETKNYVQVPATTVLEWLTNLDLAMSLADGGYPGLKEAASNSYFLRVFSNRPRYVGRFDQLDQLRTDIGPNVAALSLTLCDLEDSRRLTVLAFAVKRFQLENGDWPKSLHDLSMPSTELAPIGGEPFQLNVEIKGDSVTISSGDYSTNVR